MLLKTYHATFHVLDTWKNVDKIWQKKLSNPKTEVIFEIFKKKKCNFMCYTWYESIQHWHHWHCCWWEKTNWCLIQGWCFKKSSQYCPKKRKLRDWTMSTSRIATQHSLFWNCFRKFFYFWSERSVWCSTQPLKYRQCRQISFFEKKNYFKNIDSFGLKIF